MIGKNKIIICMIVAGLIFSSLELFINTERKSDTVIDSSSLLGNIQVKDNTRGAETVILSDDFDDGWGNFSGWSNNQGRCERRESYDGDSLAYNGHSIFMWGTTENWNAPSYTTVTTYLDLSYTSDVKLSFYYAYEDMENNYDFLWIDVDRDGNPGNGFSNSQWQVVPDADDGDHATSSNDYILKEYDLSQFSGNSNVILRFRCQFRWRDRWDIIALDNISVKVNFKPRYMKDSFNVSPAILYTLTEDNAIVNLSISDPDDHSVGDFSMTVDVRLSDNITQLRYADNISTKDPRFSMERILHGLFNLTLYFDPGRVFGFGFVDLKIILFDPDGLTGGTQYQSLENAIELKNHYPGINVSSMSNNKLRLNKLGGSSIAFSGTYQDLDLQSDSDYNLSIRIRDEDNVVYDLTTNAENGEPGLSITKISNHTYDYQYIWMPDDGYPTSYYDLSIEVNDGVGGQNISTFEDQSDTFELYRAEITGVSMEPEYCNRYLGKPIFINYTVVENISGEYDLRSVDVNISLRSSNGTIKTIYPNARRSAFQIINLTNNSFMASYKFEESDSFPDDEFDLKITIHDGAEPIFVSGYDDNLDVFSTYFNIEPQILQVSASPIRLNTYYEPELTLSVRFSDPDLHAAGLFSYEVSIKNPSDEILLVYSTGVKEVAKLTSSLAEGDVYQANITFEVNGTFEVGTYDVEVKIYDALGAGASVPFSENADLFELYFNVPPSPPDTLLPDETRDTAPFIHWYGATDTITESYDLEYYIMIGTVKGSGDVVPWRWIGKNPFYQVETALSYDTYYLEVIATDGLDNSTPLMQTLDIFVLANLPPTPPNNILPDFTMEQLPLITWSGAADGDGDSIIGNFLQIGTYPYSDDILPWVDVGPYSQYQIQNELPLGTYYVQVRVSDGHSSSYIQQELLHIVGDANAPPSPPTEMYPVKTWETTANISWVGAYDINNDTITYSIQIGSSSGIGDVLPWVDGLTTNNYRTTKELAIGKYYVQIKAFDGELFSVIFEAILEITEKGNMPPSHVSNISPSTTTNLTPTIHWDPATDPEGKDEIIVYFIQIGLSKGHGEIVSWYPVQNHTKFQLLKELAPNVIYYVQIKAFDGESYSPVAYQTLEIIVYITEISFDAQMENMTVEKGTKYTFNLRIINRGTNVDNVTVKISSDNEFLSFISPLEDSFRMSPEKEIILTLNIFVPEDSTITGDHVINAECTSEIPTFFSVTEQPLSINIVEKKVNDVRSPLEKLMEDNPLMFYGAIAMIALIILMIIIIMVVKRIKNRIPPELLDRENDKKDMAEITYSPVVKGGVVAKRIMPEASELFKKKGAAQLPSGQSPVKKLPEQKKRLALPQYSVVIDMNTKQVVGHTETDGAAKDDKDDDADIIDFQYVDGKYEIQTTSVPSAHPYQKPSPTPSVPGESLYKPAPTAPTQSKYQPKAPGSVPEPIPGAVSGMPTSTPAQSAPTVPKPAPAAGPASPVPKPTPTASGAVSPMPPPPPV